MRLLTPSRFDLAQSRSFNREHGWQALTRVEIGDRLIQINEAQQTAA
jgi:hypothetical protein